MGDKFLRFLIFSLFNHVLAAWAANDFSCDETYRVLDEVEFDLAAENAMELDGIEAIDRLEDSTYEFDITFHVSKFADAVAIDGKMRSVSPNCIDRNGFVDVGCTKNSYAVNERGKNKCLILTISRENYDGLRHNVTDRFAFQVVYNTGAGLRWTEYDGAFVLTAGENTIIRSYGTDEHHKSCVKLYRGFNRNLKTLCKSVQIKKYHENLFLKKNIQYPKKRYFVQSERVLNRSFPIHTFDAFKTDNYGFFWDTFDERVHRKYSRADDVYFDFRRRLVTFLYRDETLRAHCKNTSETAFQIGIDGQFYYFAFDDYCRTDPKKTENSFVELVERWELPWWIHKNEDVKRIDFDGLSSDSHSDIMLRVNKNHLKTQDAKGSLFVKVERRDGKAVRIVLHKHKKPTGFVVIGIKTERDGLRILRAFRPVEQFWTKTKIGAHEVDVFHRFAITEIPSALERVDIEKIYVKIKKFYICGDIQCGMRNITEREFCNNDKWTLLEEGKNFSRIWMRPYAKEENLSKDGKF